MKLSYNHCDRIIGENTYEGIYIKSWRSISYVIVFYVKFLTFFVTKYNSKYRMVEIFNPIQFTLFAKYNSFRSC